MPDAAPPMHLAARAPFDWDGLVGFVAPRAFAGVERADFEGYRRAFTIAGRQGCVHVRPAEGGLSLTVTLGPSTGRGARVAEDAIRAEVLARVRRLFDVDTDAARVSRHLARDPALAPVVRRQRGLRVPGAWDPFEIAVRAILGQQVSVKAATTLATRVVAAHGTPLDPSLAATSGLARLFPAPAALADADLVALGVIGARARCIAGLARAHADDPGLFTRHATLDALVTELTALPGIGPWTAQYVGMRALGLADAFPQGDLGLVRAWGALVGGAVTPRELLAAAERWRPWRAYAAMHLWRSLATAAGG